jgi:predicted MFS family arabinose efflux permease
MGQVKAWIDQGQARGILLRLTWLAWCIMLWARQKVYMCAIERDSQSSGPAQNNLNLNVGLMVAAWRQAHMIDQTSASPVAPM